MSNQIVSEQFLSNFPEFPSHMTPLGKFVYLRTYSRYKEKENRRETWKETVNRASQYNVNLHKKHAENIGIPYDPEWLRKENELLFENQFNLKQFLSGRTLWVGGAETGVADKYPLANFNCSFLNIKSYKDIGDLFYLLLVGTGVGFKAIKRFMKDLPPIRVDMKVTNLRYQPVHKDFRLEHSIIHIQEDGIARITVGDSKEGWVEALNLYFEVLTNPQGEYVKEVEFQYNSVRPSGEKLKTFGGTASGPEPLMEMFVGFDNVLKNKVDLKSEPVETKDGIWGQLRPIHMLDIANLIGNNVVVGGVRRTSEIDLGDADDYEFILAKYGINGIWGEEGFEHHEKIRKLFIKNKVDVPKWWDDLAVKYYYVYDVNDNREMMEGNLPAKDMKKIGEFTSPQEAIAFSLANGYNVDEYYPFPCNEVRAKLIDHRRMSNNSVAFFKKPKRWQLNLLFEIMKKEGEPGFINLYEASRRRCAQMGIYDEKIIREYAYELGLNPCAEILLASYQVCNLTTVNMVAFVNTDRYGKTSLDTKGLIEAQKLSARSGVRMTLVKVELDHWDKVQQRDRLIGTSITGEKDAMGLLGWDEEQEKSLLKMLGKVARDEADRYAKELRIPSPLLVTTVKPEGTLSQVAGGVSSGLHMSHAPHFIRRVRINAHDPLAKTVQELGWVVNPEVGTKGKTREEKMANARTLVIDFPVKSGAKRTKDDVKVDEQFDTYFTFQEGYTEHNTSNTIHVHADQWERAEQRVWDGWDNFVGVSFLSHDGGTYELAPYETITEEEYLKLEGSMKPLDMDILVKFETPGDDESSLDGMDNCETTGSCPTR